MLHAVQDLLARLSVRHATNPEGFATAPPELEARLIVFDAATPLKVHPPERSMYIQPGNRSQIGDRYDRSSCFHSKDRFVLHNTWNQQTPLIFLAHLRSRTGPYAVMHWFS